MSIALRRPRLIALIAGTTTIAAAAAAGPATAAPVTGVTTAVAPDAGLVTALTGLGAKVSLTGAATSDDAGRFVFPVTGGSLTAELKGKVGHSGGIQFTPKKGLGFGIQKFVIDTRQSPQLTAVPTLAGFALPVRVPVATIADLKVTSAPPATVVGGTLKLTDIGAFYINTFLGTSAVQRGTVFGQAEATITLGS